MDLYIALLSFPVIFVGELPDKTMFASLVLATKGKPLQVWLGAACAFLAHVVIAVTIGVALFKVLPHPVVEGIVAALFLGGGAYSWRLARTGEHEAGAGQTKPAGSALLSALVVIFVAEWGDLTQILTANLAARYHDPLAVGLGAVLALWAVAALAVLGGRTLLQRVDVRLVRRVTAVVLVALGLYSALSAIGLA